MLILATACLLIALTGGITDAVSRGVLETCLPRPFAREREDALIEQCHEDQDTIEQPAPQRPETLSPTGGGVGISGNGATDDPRSSHSNTANDEDKNDTAASSPRTTHDETDSDQSVYPAEHLRDVSARGRGLSRVREPSPSSRDRRGRPTSPASRRSQLRRSVSPARASAASATPKGSIAAATPSTAAAGAVATAPTTTQTAVAKPATGEATPRAASTAASTPPAKTAAAAAATTATASATTATVSTTATTAPAASVAPSPSSLLCSALNLEAGDFAMMEAMVNPGDLRGSLIDALENLPVGRFAEGCAAVRQAQIGLNGDCLRAGTLVEGKTLGEGSFGVVKAAHHSVIPGRFAVKMLKEGVTEAARYSIVVEMITLARLAKAPHPHVVSAVAIDDREGAVRMPILLPRAETDFGAVLRSGECNEASKLRWLQQVAAGLRHMHAQGIGHGDVKPDNILLFEDGMGWYVAKVSDFGMSRAIGETRPKRMGTPGFMALEVILGEAVTRESQDVFAMGAVAFIVCVAEDKAQSNMFISPELYTKSEKLQREALDALGTNGGQSVAKQTHVFEMNMTIRTMSDGTFAKLLTVDNLHPNLGSAADKELVSWCLPPFMDPVPSERPSMADFEKVVGNIAFAAEEWEDGFP